MSLQTQVKVFTADLASFGGVRLRRVNVLVGGQAHQLLLHEAGQTGTGQTRSGQAGAFVVSTDTALPATVELILKAEWGEPLGTVTKLQVEAVSGEVEGYAVQVRVRGAGVVTVELRADATFWWNGELCCTKRAAYYLRDVQRGRRDPQDARTVTTPRPRVRANAA